MSHPALAPLSSPQRWHVGEHSAIASLTAPDTALFGPTLIAHLELRGDAAAAIDPSAWHAAFGALRVHAALHPPMGSVLCQPVAVSHSPTDLALTYRVEIACHAASHLGTEAATVELRLEAMAPAVGVGLGAARASSNVAAPAGGGLLALFVHNLSAEPVSHRSRTPTTYPDPNPNAYPNAYPNACPNPGWSLVAQPCGASAAAAAMYEIDGGPDGCDARRENGLSDEAHAHMRSLHSMDMHMCTCACKYACAQAKANVRSSTWRCPSPTKDRPSSSPPPASRRWATWAA